MKNLKNNTSNENINLNKQIKTFILDKFDNKKVLKDIKCDKNCVACFTGHRPKNLPNEQNVINNVVLLNIKKELKKKIIESIENGYTYFISGVAEGIDLISAEIVIELKKEYPSIFLECAIPHIEQFIEYSTQNKERYRNILCNADYINVISNNYSSTCYMKRNKYMVDKSSLVIAVWNGNKGGTKNTIDYAIKKNVKCAIITF